MLSFLRTVQCNERSASFRQRESRTLHDLEKALSLNSESLYPLLCFSQSEMRLISSHITRAAHKVGYFYDMEISFVSQRNALYANRVDLIRLISSSFGYEFVLSKILMQPSVITRGKTVVDIYRSVTGRDNYTYFQTASSLSAAIDLVNEGYALAAQNHLPQ